MQIRVKCVTASTACGLADEINHVLKNIPYDAGIEEIIYKKYTEHVAYIHYNYVE